MATHEMMPYDKTAALGELYGRFKFLAWAMRGMASTFLTPVPFPCATTAIPTADAVDA
jgi:hypothetical protein